MLSFDSEEQRAVDLKPLYQVFYTMGSFCIGISWFSVVICLAIRVTNTNEKYNWLVDGAEMFTVTTYMDKKLRQIIYCYNYK